MTSFFRGSHKWNYRLQWDGIKSLTHDYLTAYRTLLLDTLQFLTICLQATVVDQRNRPPLNYIDDGGTAHRDAREVKVLHARQASMLLEEKGVGDNKDDDDDDDDGDDDDGDCDNTDSSSPSSHPACTSTTSSETNPPEAIIEECSSECLATTKIASSESGRCFWGYIISTHITESRAFQKETLSCQGKNRGKPKNLYEEFARSLDITNSKLEPVIRLGAPLIHIGKSGSATLLLLLDRPKMMKQLSVADTENLDRVSSDDDLVEKITKKLDTAIRDAYKRYQEVAADVWNVKGRSAMVDKIDNIMGKRINA
ncbi:uncharacterized protein Z520_11748 [Fonsecaea multimorphosa CBS 102226]|uniref:Uncharacterized protein n=1 Tax=Fonsecaea multimorphosa CBS 102226 TaxID=1442371 RepID=A0A0D2JHB9_9EURO|nr:uncharacterized protein Z520_11748 [Fonsecaea multimorphosa CBS 102226]KIX92572.1 hypothetical protein Z520_11748 [Fonsecaea multimorphosa CBS 102226]